MRGVEQSEWHDGGAQPAEERRHRRAVRVVDDGSRRRRGEDAVYGRSRDLMRRMDRMQAGTFIVAAIVALGMLNAGSTFFQLAQNAGGAELFGLLRWAAVPAVIALAVRRRQHDALTAAAQLALILACAEALGLGLLWPLIEHPGVNMPALMGLGLGQRLSATAAIVPIGAVVVWGVRHFGDRRRGGR